MSHFVKLVLGDYKITEIPKNTINPKIFSESYNFSREFNSIYLFSD